MSEDQNMSKSSITASIAAPKNGMRPKNGANERNFFDMRTAESNKKLMKTVAAVAAAVAA